MITMIKQLLLLDMARLDVAAAAIKEAMPDGYPRDMALAQIDAVRSHLVDMAEAT